MQVVYIVTAEHLMSSNVDGVPTALGYNIVWTSIQKSLQCGFKTFLSTVKEQRINSLDDCVFYHASKEDP